MKTPEQFAEAMTETLGARLRAVAVYGSAAVGENTWKYSDINTVVVVDRVDVSLLSAAARALAPWIKAGQPAPIFVEESQLRRSQDVFPIELGDIRDRHRVLMGAGDLFTSIEVQPAHLRRQLEFELRSKLMLLRRTYMETVGSKTSVADLMAAALSSLTALFRGVLRLLGQRPPASTAEVIRALDARVPLDGEAWETVARLRQNGKLPPNADANALFDRLLAGLQKVIDFVDAHPAS